MIKGKDALLIEYKDENGEKQVKNMSTIKRRK
jgi:hypothetical protein